MPAPDIAYLDPITITKGGKYTGNYRSLDSNIPAITINCYEPVEIANCVIAHAGIGIKCSGGTKLTAHYNQFYGLKPTGNAQWGRALDNYHPQYLIFDRNYIEHTGGILVDHSDQNTKSAAIRYNVIKDTDKRKADGTTGDHRAGILFNTVLPITGEIAWNQFTNTAGASFIEDNINMMNSGGTADSPFFIHDNFIFGAYPFPLNADSYTGSGITIDGDPDHNQVGTMSQYIDISGNQVVSTCNAAINIAAGHHINAHSNRMVSSGMFPDGTKSPRFWAGCCIWDGSNVGGDKFTDNSIKDNIIGYVCWGQNEPFSDRHDQNTVSGSPISIKPEDNIHLPNPITPTTEQNEWTIWAKKLLDNKITLAMVTTTTVPADDVVLPGAAADKDMVIGDSVEGSIVARTENAPHAGYKAGSVKLAVDDPSKMDVSIVGGDETRFKLTALLPGFVTLTATLVTNRGKTLTKQFTVAIADEATEIEIIF